MPQHTEQSVLDKIYQFEQSAKSFGFYWSNVDLVIDQIMSECKEVKEAIANCEGEARIQEEMGDLMASAVALCIFLGFDVTSTMESNLQKLTARMAHVKQLTLKRGLTDLNNQPEELKMEIWNEIKQYDK